MDIYTMNKAELHCHLDGSLPKEFMEKRLGRSLTRQEISVGDECENLAECLEKFDLPLLTLQDEEGLKQAAYAFSRASAADHVTYAEVRYAPMLHRDKGLQCPQIMAAVREGMEQGRKDFGVDYGIIACAMRHHSVSQNIQMFEEVSDFYGKGLVAYDLAGGEADFPNQLFPEIFAKARELRIPYTIHSGETGSLENVKLALEFGASRIGHGTALKQDRGLMKAFAEAGIGVEMCPTSNFQTKAVRSWAEYPIYDFLEAGIPVSINTDNRTVSDTTLTRELEKVYAYYKDEGMIRDLVENGFKSRFR